MRKPDVGTFGQRYLGVVESRFSRPVSKKIWFWLPNEIVGHYNELTGSGDESAKEGKAAAPSLPVTRSMARTKPRRNQVRLFDPERLRALRDSATNSLSYSERKKKELLQKASRFSELRTVGFSSAARRALPRLRSEFPHFRDVIAHVELALVVSRYARRPTRLAPMLLLGPAGVGKSYFVERLAAALGLPVHRQQMDCATTSATLAGMDPTWHNAGPGVVFEALTQGEYANPIFILDEIDKAGGRYQYDPLAPLHSLLEPCTAQRFEDAFVQLPIDASHIVWIATANDRESLPLPIRSRFVEFDIALPEPNAMAELVQRMFERLLQSLGLASKVSALTPDAAQDLATLTPRTIRLRLERAIGKALLAGRSQVTLADVRHDVVAIAGIRMGFLADRPPVPASPPADQGFSPLPSLQSKGAA